MDDARKNAYRYLLYWAMLDIRPIAYLRVCWWNPRQLMRDFRRARLAGHIADRMHNLARDAGYEFKGFDEEWFWTDLDGLTQRFPEFKPERYRHYFERRLEEADSKSA
jgi:hypothetical protein